MKIVAILYPGGPTAKDTPELLGCAENALGLREMVEAQGHELVSISDADTELDSHLATVDVLIATPFWPAYMTKERIEKSPANNRTIEAEYPSIPKISRCAF